MSHVPPLLSLVLSACAAAVPLLILCAVSRGQEPEAAAVEALVRRIEAARGKPVREPVSLTVEGSYTVTFEGAPGGEPVAAGKFREAFVGADLARHVSEMGEHGTMERGTTAALAWELDPAMGAKVHSGAQAATVRRYFGLLRGASPRELYRQIARAGVRELDGRQHDVLRMTPAEGKADTWYVDRDSGRVTRVDIALPTPESADAAFGIDDAMDAQISFGDWREVGGVQYAHERVTKMGPATVTHLCSKIAAGVEIEPARFTPPEAVRKLERQPVQKAFDADGKPVQQLVTREAQPVASIRVKCKPAEISATLAVVLPEVMAHLNATGAKMAGAPFSRYHAFGDQEIDLEAGIPVTRPITETDRVKNSELPGGKTATAWHIGPYDQLGAAHTRLQAFVDRSGLKARGGPWEVYWTDPGMVPDATKWRTQLFLPIEE